MSTASACQVPEQGWGRQGWHPRVKAASQLLTDMHPTSQGMKAGPGWQPWYCAPRLTWTLPGSSAMCLRICHRMPDPGS